MSGESTPGPTAGTPPRRAGAPAWAKLWSVVVVANFAGMLVAVWVARLIRAVPASESTETWLQFGLYAAILVVAFLEALLVDELAFKGAFRRTHLQGRARTRVGGDDEVEQAAVALQRSTVSFPIAVLVCALFTRFLFGWVNGGLDGWYDRIGRNINALHRDDPERARQAIDELSIHREPDVAPALQWRMLEGGETAPWAAWALGRHRDVENRRPFVVPLVKASRSDDPLLHREAVVALGRLQHQASAPEIEELLRGDLEAGTIDLRLVYALGAVQVIGSLDVLEAVLHRGDPEAQRLAAWALAQHRDLRGGRKAVEILEARLPTAAFGLRCAIVHALGILSDERSNLALMRAYDESTPEELTATCEHVRVYMRPDGQADSEDVLMPAETLQTKVLASMGQMRATTPEIRARVEPWLAELAANGPVEVREPAASVLAGIRASRDDSKLAPAEP